MHHRHLASLRTFKPLCLDAQAALTRRPSPDTFFDDEREDVVQGRLPGVANLGRRDVGAECECAL